jgi:hypothetical protein
MTRCEGCSLFGVLIKSNLTNNKNHKHHPNQSTNSITTKQIKIKMVSVPLLLLLNLSLLLGASSAHNNKPKRIDNTFRAGSAGRDLAQTNPRALAGNITGVPRANVKSAAGHGMGVKSSGSSPQGGVGTKTGMKKKAPPAGTKSANLRAGGAGGEGPHNAKSGSMYLEVSLFTDGFPWETSHFLYDVDYDTYLFYYDIFDSYSYYPESWQLDPDGCYQYYILDSFGDGMESGYGAIVMVNGWEVFNSGAYGSGVYVPMGRWDCV